MEVKIAFDVDGTITRIGFLNPSIKLPWWLFSLLALLILFEKPDKATVQRMQQMQARGCKFTAVTAWPRQFHRFAERFLNRHDVPFQDVFCVGPGKGTKERKLDVFLDQGISIFFEKDRRVEKFFKARSIRVVNNLDDIIAS